MSRIAVTSAEHFPSGGCESAAFGARASGRCVELAGVPPEEWIGLLVERKKSEPEVLVVHFLVPKFDRNRKPYRRSVHKNLRKDLEQRFGGWSSLGDKPLPGAWMNPESGDIEYDESWRYEVGIAPERLRELDEYLAELAYHLKQKAIWRVSYAGGEGRVIPARPPTRRE